ncbi:MAG TPA: hypothetical protein VK423_00360 [Thermoplasmata archaeon]|nr:hypothetical protein [Thermoplasmata archaeon]
MNWRVWISVANLAAIMIAFVILFEFPQYANDAFYVLITWMVAGFILLYAIRPRGSGVPVGSLDASSPFPSSSAATAPLPSGPEGGGLGFCIYCAAPIVPGARACPSCGHALPRW